jgi:hypothetical protein
MRRAGVAWLPAKGPGSDHLQKPPLLQHRKNHPLGRAHQEDLVAGACEEQSPQLRDPSRDHLPYWCEFVERNPWRHLGADKSMVEQFAGQCHLSMKRAVDVGSVVQAGRASVFASAIAIGEGLALLAPGH